MNLSDSILKSCIAVIVFAGVVFPLHAQQTAFDRLKDRFEKGQIFTAEFGHHYVDSYTGDSTATKGMIWVGKDRYKVHTQNQSVVVDGKTSMVYDDSRNRVIISNYDPSEDDFAPSRILNGADSTYTLDNQQKVGGYIVISLSSDDPFAVFKKVKLTLTEDLVPLEIFVLDQAENRITTTFGKGKFIPYKRGMFHLDYPDGAEIVDMRN